jgi:hypothetical protein
VTADLAEFLRARLDEDERIARGVQDGSPPWDGQWIPDGPHALRTRNGHVLACSTVTTDGRDLPIDLKPGLVEHWARHDPARVLAEVAAKRRLLDETYPELQWADSAAAGEWNADQEAALDFLKILALPYAGHPGYRPEWAPGS